MAVAKKDTKKAGTKPVKTKASKAPVKKPVAKKKKVERPDKEFGRIEKSKTRDLVVSKTTYNGQDKLDIREFGNTTSYSGPTKSGINIPLEMAADLLELLTEVCEEYDMLEDGE